MSDERVLCVSSDALCGLVNSLSSLNDLTDKSYIPAQILSLPSILGLLNQNMFFPRSECENDVSLRQLCTYSVLNNYGNIVSYQRTKLSGEGRLKGKRSIGVGGHINDSDFLYSSNNILNTTEIKVFGAAIREIEEEIKIISNYNMPSLSGSPSKFNLRYVGLILIQDSSKLDSSAVPVDLVHAGLVFEAHFRCHSIAAKENSMSDIRTFADFNVRDEIRNDCEYERWSQILIRQMKYPISTYFH